MRPAVPAACAAALLFSAVFIARTATRIGGETYFVLFDDAMISMRYAQNLAGGFGLVWNPTEAAVEGYTNPLWTLWMAMIHRLPIAESKTALVVMLSGAAILVANVSVTARIARIAAGGSTFAAALAAWLTALYFGLAFWTLRGTEVGLVTLLANGALLAALRIGSAAPPGARRSATPLGLLLAAGVLVRPDALVTGAAVAAGAVALAPPTRRRRLALLLVTALAVPLVASTLFRIAYYADPLPNTYYLKLTGTPLAARVARGLAVLGALVAAHLGWPALVALGGARRSRAGSAFPGARRAQLLLAGLVLAQCAYSAYVGGDAWEWMPYANRYIAVAMPSLLVLASVGASRAAASVLGPERSARRERRLRRAWALAAGALVAAGLYAAARFARNPWAAGAYDAARKAGAAGMVAAGLAALVAARAGPRVLDRALDRVSPGELESGGPRALAIGAALFLALWLPTSGPAFKSWLFYNAAEAPLDAVHARLGLLLRETTREAARIAVGPAGTIPYFAHRSAIDLLGKNDPVVAKGPSVRADFKPGHTKWNLDHSIVSLRPDVVVHAVRDGAERALLQGAGYDSLGVELWVRADSRLVDREALARGWLPP
jgi:hypothetical protein